MSFTHAGFAVETRTVAVGLDRETTLNVVLHPEAAEEITVVGSAPAVDPTSTTLGADFTIRDIQTLPSGRNYSSVVQVTPRISSDAHPENNGQSTITVYGSTGARTSTTSTGSTPPWRAPSAGTPRSRGTE